MINSAIKFPIQPVTIREIFVVQNIKISETLKLSKGVNLSPFEMVKDEVIAHGELTLGQYLSKSDPDNQSLVILFEDSARKITSFNPNEWLPSESVPEVHAERKKVFSAILNASDLNPVIQNQVLDLPGMTANKVSLDQRMAYVLKDVYHFFGQLGVRAPIQIKSIPVALIKERYDMVRKLSKHDYAAYEVAQSRLANAKIKRDAVDAAIDTGIAAEVIFLHGEKGAGAKGELRYKIANRAAWFLGQNSEERKVIAKICRKGYDARSSAAHTGLISPKKRTDSKAFAKVCDDALKKVLNEAGIPKDWNEIIF